MKFLCFKVFFLQREEDEDFVPEYNSFYAGNETAMKLTERVKEMSVVENLSSEDSFDHLLKALAEYMGRMERSISKLEECVERLKRECHKRRFKV